MLEACLMPHSPGACSNSVVGYRIERVLEVEIDNTYCARPFNILAVPTMTETDWAMVARFSIGSLLLDRDRPHGPVFNLWERNQCPVSPYGIDRQRARRGSYKPLSVPLDAGHLVLVSWTP